MNTERPDDVIQAVSPDFHGLSYRERLIVGAVLKRLSTPPADDVREALAKEEDDYEPERACALCRREDVHEEAEPFDDNGVWRHLPGGAVICDRCGMAADDATKAAKGEVRPRGTVTEDERAAINVALIRGLPLWVSAVEEGHARKSLLDGIVQALEAGRGVRS